MIGVRVAVGLEGQMKGQHTVAADLARCLAELADKVPLHLSLSKPESGYRENEEHRRGIPLI